MADGRRFQLPGRADGGSVSGGTLLRLAAFEAPAAAPLRIVDAAVTDRGLVRPANEDAFLRRSDERVWAVADGMGGHEGGAWASAAIVHALQAARLTGDFEQDAEAVARSLHEANRLIHTRAEACRIRMGSTVAALLLIGRRLTALWAGDSRVYRLRDGVLARLTRDHTQVQDKVEQGLLAADQARTHPMAHVLTRAVGVEPNLDLATVHAAAVAGDVFLLCSDGLHGVADDAEILAALAGRSPSAACEALLALAQARGAPDNVTVIVVACGAEP